MSPTFLEGRADYIIFAGLTHYGARHGPIYFGADYAARQKWRQLGLIASVSNILIRASAELV